MLSAKRSRWGGEPPRLLLRLKSLSSEASSSDYAEEDSFASRNAMRG